MTIDADGDGYNWIYNNNDVDIATHDNSLGSVYSQSFVPNANEAF